MAPRDFSGEDIYTVLVNVGNFDHVRTTGDHVILRWEPPADHDTTACTAAVPLHDSVNTGTLHDIASDAGAEDFDAVCRWIDRNRYQGDATRQERVSEHDCVRTTGIRNPHESGVGSGNRCQRAVGLLVASVNLWLHESLLRWSQRRCHFDIWFVSGCYAGDNSRL